MFFNCVLLAPWHSVFVVHSEILEPKLWRSCDLRVVSLSFSFFIWNRHQALRQYLARISARNYLSVFVHFSGKVVPTSDDSRRVNYLICSHIDFGHVWPQGSYDEAVTTFWVVSPLTRRTDCGLSIFHFPTFTSRSAVSWNAVYWNHRVIRCFAHCQRWKRAKYSQMSLLWSVVSATTNEWGFSKL